MPSLRERVDAAELAGLSAAQRDELERELAEADALEDLPGWWQAALLEAEGAAPSCHCSHGSS
jgi:hypothetical protein